VHLVAYLGENGPALGLPAPSGRVVALAGATGGLDLALAEARLPGLLEEAARILPTVSGGDATPDIGVPRSELILSPAVEFPGKVVCIGLNYAEHVKEGGRAGPPHPLLFGKFGNAVIGDGEPIIRPEGTRALDLEAELGVVIGRRARRVSADRAMAHVAGYVVANDVSARDWQGVPAALREGERGDGQWLRAKGSDTFLPVGADFVTPDEVDPTAGLRIRSWRIPGSGPDAGREILMQDGSTADMILRVPELIEFISRHITLEAGDLIATGTPAGVGVYRDPPVFLEPGDRVRCQVDGIGSVENPVVDWNELPQAEDEPAD
jgi:2,4-didehydro-3-deoxy-L-rhamnonate hydrolase